ncbi:MAG: hypothetical protein FJ034_05170, partial [Chloroflexi bacterium]|nr:hypothetical protein [Chloroflexota bacterium]
MRPLVGILGALILVAACGPAEPQSTTPTKTPDIRRSKLDIAYTALMENDVHKVSSKKVLTEALEAVRQLAKASGGSADIATPEFKDTTDGQLADFRAFANAVGTIAQANPGLRPDEIADTVLRSYTRSSPDCHTYYVPRRAAAPASVLAAAHPPAGAGAVSADEAGLDYRMLP